MAGPGLSSFILKSGSSAVRSWRTRADFRPPVSEDGRQPGRISKSEGHLFFFEEVLIYLFQDEGFFDDDAAVVFDHECCQFGAVDEDKACIDAFGVVAGVGAETGRGDEHSAAGLGAAACPDKGLDVHAADVPVGVALGLDVDRPAPPCTRDSACRRGHAVPARG